MVIDLNLADKFIQEKQEFEDDQRRQRRMQRIIDCGKYAWHFDPHTGHKNGYIRFCDNFRECQTCLERRAKKEYEWMKKKVYEGKIKMVCRIVSSREEANRLVRGVNKDQYVRYPQEDGTEIIFFDKEANVNGNPINPGWMRGNKDKWSKWVLTPEGRNKSGTMHVPATPEEKEPFTTVTIKQFVADAPDSTVSEIMDKVVEETEHMRPETPEEVEQFSETRFMMATAQLSKQGISFRVYEQKMKVYHNKIDWSKSREVNLMVNTENLTQLPSEFPPGF